MTEIKNTAYKIITSRKGQAWLFYCIMITAMAFLLHGSYEAWGGYFLGGLTMFGVGVQNDKKIDASKGGAV